MIKRLSASISLPLMSLVLPTLASAQGANIDSVLSTVSTVLNALIGLFITLALIIFFWGLIKYLSAGGAEGSAEGLKIMFWGAITLFVMVSIWGIIKLLQNTFKVGDATITPPKGFEYRPGGGGGVEIY